MVTKTSLQKPKIWGVNLKRKRGVNLLRKQGGQIGAELGGQYQRIFQTKINFLSATPNPASSELLFTYKLYENKPGYILLRDHLGDIKAKLPVVDNSGSIRWNCEGLSPGAYFYSLETNDQLLIEPKSILIIK